MERATNRIRIMQSEIEAQLEDFDTAPDAVSVKTSYVCDNVRDCILNFDDEPHLSKTQNSRRRIVIATELFNSFCGIFANVVDNEYAITIRDIIQWEKFKRLSHKIISDRQLTIRREKYFAGEARSKLLTGSEIRRTEEPTEVVTPAEEEGRLTDTNVVTRQERESLAPGPDQAQITREEIAEQEMNETLAPQPPPPLEGSFGSELPSNITEIREAVADTAHSQLLMSPTTRQELLLPHIDAETSITAPNVQQMSQDEEGIERILQILEDGIFDTETVQEPENIEPASESAQPVVEETAPVPENPPTGDGTEPETAAPESSERWSLPSLEDIESLERKRRHPIIDRTTVIRDYAARAVKLNRNISIQRVQVFEGPPSVLQAISANYLMTTPGYKKSLFRDRRSSKLSTLYNRHLEVEKKPVEEILQHRRLADETEPDVLKVTANTEIMESVGMRAGMQSRPGRSSILIDSRVPEKDQQAELELTAAGAPTTESHVGIPVSRIINSVIEPPEEGQMERINAASEQRRSSVQQLQGRSLEERRTSPPWFISTRENPPSEKYREFNYVYDRLHVYWSMFESQRMEKRITIREFMSFEGSETSANYLTVLRVADKLSIRRKLLLEYENGDVVVRPFEIPYVTEAQVLLRGKEPVL